MDDCLILGGGVIGLSLAYELAGHGLKVHVLDRAAPAQEASWAGAGILPPGNLAAAKSADDQLAGLAHELHPRWSAQIQEETGICNGYRRCGGLYLAADHAGEQGLNHEANIWRELDVAVEVLAPCELTKLEPGLACGSPPSIIRSALLLPGEAQLRNPRHLKGLLAACTRRGVRISTATAGEGFVVENGRIRAVRTSAGDHSAEAICIASGSWSGELLAHLGQRPPLRPIRGQMVLLACDAPPFTRVVNLGRRYLVPREDGRVLIGSTEEDVGFEKQNTAAGVAGLLQFALELAPTLAGAPIERTWAGLRPATPDERPYLGRVPGLDNAFVAAGHFRKGLQLSTATAVVLGQLIRGQEPQISLETFGIDRH